MNNSSPEQILIPYPKKCTQCLQIKSPDEFYECSDRVGLRSACKVCTKKRKTEYRKKHREDINRRGKEYREKHQAQRQAQRQRYRQGHQKKIKEYERRYALEHKAQRARSRKKYNQTHREDIRAYEKVKRQRQTYREYHRAYEHKRRNQRNGLPATLTEEEWQRILSRHYHRCHYCGVGETSDNILQREHKVPLSKGGGYTRENIVPACRRCNLEKHVLTDKEFEKQVKPKWQLELSLKNRMGNL